MPAFEPILTARLRLRELGESDDAFLVELLNDEGFLRHIGDRGVRTREDARRYLAEGPTASYAREGFGLWAVERRGDGALVGMCGLLRRDTLPDPDIGYAFLPAFRGQGYAREACEACVVHAFDVLRWPRLLAIVNEGNAASRGLLERLGFALEGPIQVGGNDVLLYAAVRERLRPGSGSGS